MPWAVRPTPALLAAWLVCASCRSDAHDPPPGRRQELAAAIQAVHERMHVRFAAALLIEQAIAHSDLERARSEAHRLAELDEPESLPAWRPYVDSIRQAARQIELSTTIAGAARLTATLGRRCGRCHDAIEARIELAAEPAPPADRRLAPQMQSHQWAAAQMWQGLIGPSDERWLAGARALTTVPLTIVAQSVTPTSDQDVDDVARVRLYAKRALVAGSQDDRADLYGTLLITCAHCHATLRDR